MKDVILDKFPDNLKIIAYNIQKDIVCAAIIETTNIILNDLGCEFFVILIDVSRDVLVKKKMVVVQRCVNVKGCVIECFIGIVHIKNTIALSLKETIEALFSKHRLTISHLLGHGYDGASNIQAEFHGLKALIMKDNPSTYYIHCFFHQL